VTERQVVFALLSVIALGLAELGRMVIQMADGLRVLVGG
jgi:hypothetical protein